MSRQSRPTVRAFAAVTASEVERWAVGEPVAPEAGWHPVGQPGSEPDEEAAEDGMDAAADDAAAREWPVVVVAADLPVGEGDEAGSVAEARIADVASFHLGDDVVSQGRLEATSPWELSWYDVAEVSEVRRLLG